MSALCGLSRVRLATMRLHAVSADEIVVERLDAGVAFRPIIAKQMLAQLAMQGQSALRLLHRYSAVAN